jgi:hydroxymethylpyrimidine/phosphomethylpyrimidine kinase
VTLWVVGGVDPTGGAGIGRDLWAVGRSTPDVPAGALVTAFTRQGTGARARAFAVSPGRLRACARALPPPRVLKLGLVPDELAEEVEALARNVARPLVLDPVLHASDGGWLGGSAQTSVRLAGCATLVTPNRVELEAMSDVVGCAARPEELAAALGTAVLAKQVPAEPDRVCDRLVVNGIGHDFVRSRVPGADPRGTGCALASAIAGRIHRGQDLIEATRVAIAWLDRTRLATRPGPDGRAQLH